MFDTIWFGFLLFTFSLDGSVVLMLQCWIGEIQKIFQREVEWMDEIRGNFNRDIRSKVNVKTWNVSNKSDSMIPLCICLDWLCASTNNTHSKRFILFYRNLCYMATGYAYEPPNISCLYWWNKKKMRIVKCVWGKADYSYISNPIPHNRWS